jgi:hypothetical protein
VARAGGGRSGGCGSASTIWRGPLAWARRSDSSGARRA